MQKKKDEISGFKLFVKIVFKATKDPNKYAPLSPKNIFAFGKLNLRKINVKKERQNKRKAMLSFPLTKFIKNKTVNIIKEWMPNKPLNPSIKLDPLIINKKHKQMKNNAKTSISKRLFKKVNPVFSM